MIIAFTRPKLSTCLYAIMPISPAAASGTRYPHDVTASAKSDKPTESGG